MFTNKLHSHYHKFGYKHKKANFVNNNNNFKVHGYHYEWKGLIPADIPKCICCIKIFIILKFKIFASPIMGHIICRQKIIISLFSSWQDVLTTFLLAYYICVPVFAMEKLFFVVSEMLLKWCSRDPKTFTGVKNLFRSEYSFLACVYIHIIILHLDIKQFNYGTILMLYYPRNYS